MPRKRRKKGICCFLNFFEKKQKRKILLKLKSVQNEKYRKIDRKIWHSFCQPAGKDGKLTSFQYGIPVKRLCGVYRFILFNFR